MRKCTKNRIIPSAVTLLLGILIIIVIPYQIKIKSDSIMNPRFFPYIASLTIVIISIFEIIIQLRNKKEQKDTYSPENGIKKNYFGVLLACICLLLWIILIPYLGFIITSFAFLIGIMVIIGNRNIIQIILVPLIVTLITYYLFIVLLNINFS